MNVYDVSITIFNELDRVSKRASFNVTTDDPAKIIEAINDVLHMRFDKGSRNDVKATDKHT